MYNLVVLIGNLGADPEVRTAGETKVCNLRLATTSRIKKKGEWVDHTDWHRVVCFGKLAENCEKYLKKGRQIMVEGQIRYGSYEKDGETKYTTDIIADEVKFLGGKGGEKRSEDSSDGGGEEQPDPSIPF